MNDFDRVKGLVVGGDKERAIALLASMLLKDRNNVDAWLFLGELIDDPARKRDCYRWALKLSPHNLQALTRLQELGEPEPVPVYLPVTSPQDEVVEISPQADTVETRRHAAESKQNVRFIPSQSFYPPPEPSRSGLEIFAYVVGGIAVFLVLLYVITRPGRFTDDINNNPASDMNNLYVALIFISLIAIMIILTLNERNRR